MKLWSFLFTRPDHDLQSARVAAPDRVVACMIMGAELGVDITPARDRRTDVICQYAGEVEMLEASLVRAVRRDGRLVIGSAA